MHWPTSRSSIALVAVSLAAFSLTTPAVASDSPDTTPPVLTLPAPMSVEPQDAYGAFVYYFATAWDESSGYVSVNCTPGAGIFPIGTTTVECSAADYSGNVATASFTITVLEPLMTRLTIAGGTVNPATGVVTIRGTLECTRAGVPAQASAFLYGDVAQRAGRIFIHAGFGTMYEPSELTCSSPATPWSFTGMGSSGLFVGGPATVHALAGTGNQIGNSLVDTAIKLSARS
jgi:hypothetical protein